MTKKEQLYEGKAKKVFATEEPELLIVSYKDDATAFNGLKKGTIVGKGVINNRMSNLLMQRLEKAGILTHFVEELSDRETLVKKYPLYPLKLLSATSLPAPFQSAMVWRKALCLKRLPSNFPIKTTNLAIR